MSRKLLALIVAGSLLPVVGHADVPRVAADIGPVHSLVARVMQDIGEPELVIPPGASPHEYSLRPSQAAALQEAELVFWVGADLTPWFQGAIEALAGDARVIALLDAEGTRVLDMREDPAFEVHSHGEGHDDHGHAAAHGAQDDGASVDHHGHDDDGHHDHTHSDAHAARDPHAWLSPENAGLWLDTIAGALSLADPGNAAAYAANAAAGRAELAAVSGEVAEILRPVRGRHFIVFHDAYRYFETYFDFPASGAISLSDSADPGPGRIAAIQDRVAEQGVHCVLAEPQFNPGLVATVMEGTAARTGILDPLGSDLEPGPALYPQMLRNLAHALAECLQE